MNSQGIAGYPPSPYIVNLIELQNTINNASGLTGTSALTNAVADIQKMVDFQKKQINANALASYDTNSITVLSNMTFAGGATLTVDGEEVTGGGGGAGGNSIAAGRTSIVLQSVSSPLIAMNIQRRPIFTFNQVGNALYFDASGIANQFNISSSRLILDTVSMKGTQMAPAAGRFLYSTDVSGNAIWANVSSIRADNTYVESRAADNTIRFTNNNAESARFTATGNLGLKTTTPSSELDVNGKTKTTTFQLTSGAVTGRYLQASDNAGNTTWADVTVPASSNIQAGTNSVNTVLANNSITFITANTLQATLNQVGYLGLGVTNPAYRLDVDSIGRIPLFYTSDIYPINTFLRMYGPLEVFAYIYSSDYIYSVGPVYGTSFVNISDRNLKNSIQSLSSGETDAILGKLNGVRFKWNRDDKQDIGFIAQDVQPHFPEAVAESRGALAIDYQKFIPLLVESVKGLRKRVEDLEKEIVDLKSRVPA